MKNERKTTQDLTQLSAYLDDALSTADRQALEARLIREPELRSQLENLQVTRHLIRRLPRLKAPRNFTLTPEMVPVRRRKQKPLFTTLRLVSSLAALLLVVLFSVELLINNNLLPGPAPAGKEYAAEETSLAEGGTPEPLILWTDPGVGGAGGIPEGYGGDALPFEAPEEALPEIEMAPPEETRKEPTFQPEEATPTKAAETEALTAPMEEAPMPILGVNQDEAGEIIDRSRTESLSEDDPFLTLRWVQIGLAVIALGGGITLLIIKQQ
jgi:hypothetical protein